MTQIRKFKELALCHLPDEEIQWLSDLKDSHTVFKSASGFFVATFTGPLPPVLTGLLQNQDVDFILFDIDVEPSPNLEIYDD